MASRDPAESPKAAPRSGPRSLARNLRDLSHLPGSLALARLGYGLKRPVFALPIYRYSLTGAAPTALAAIPPDPWPGDAGRGAEIVQGVFDLAGQRLANPAPLWTPAGAGAAWLGELHGFGWLRDLRAAGGDGARRVARDLVGAWLESHGRWSAATSSSPPARPSTTATACSAPWPVRPSTCTGCCRRAWRAQS
jgi:uncharacterized heparinase superfamily protein